jgi:2-oxoglutarate dehydrogenase E1 component
LPDFSIDQKKSILRKLNEAVSLRTFAPICAKRFLEGGESIIPALDTLIKELEEQFVMGMAHRRLNIGKHIWQNTRYFRRIRR